MRLLMVGDVVGRPGRQAVGDLMPRLRTAYRPDFVVVNAENAAGGVGITPDLASSILGHDGVDVITLGNHAWAKREVYPYLDAEPRVLRPANYPAGAPGRGWGIFQTPEGLLGVAALQGRTFMGPADDPFRTADTIIDEVSRSTSALVFDFHGEATSEKQAFGWYVDGRASAVLGTHTHVQTADERLLPGGTAYLSDVGMTGPYDSVIGMRAASVMPRFTTLLPSRFEVAEGPVLLNGVVLDIDMLTGRATSIARVLWRPGDPAPVDDMTTSLRSA